MVTKKRSRRIRIKRGIRKKIIGTAERPRLTVYKSNREMYVQIINDDSGHTLISASSREPQIAGKKGTKSEMAKMVGQAIAEKAKGAGIEKVVFDRNGFLYHGRVKALADGAREGGMKF